MKSRNREINIFNMSLLDILCGALGAFCFMMIVLLPYYKPENLQDQKKQQELDETIKNIDDLTKKLADAKLAKELQDLIEKLKAQIKELEGRVNSLSQENKELAGKNKQLDDKNKQLEKEKKDLDSRNQQLQKENNQLAQRLPGMVVAYCPQPLPGGATGLMDVVVWVPNPNPGGPSPPPFNPKILLNGKFFDGDSEVTLYSASPSAIFLYRDAAIGIRQKVYVKLSGVQANGKDPPTMLPLTSTVKIGGLLSSGSPDTYVEFPPADLTPEHPWMLYGFLETAKDHKVSFVVATPAEREEEWRKLR